MPKMKGFRLPELVSSSLLYFSRLQGHCIRGLSSESAFSSCVDNIDAILFFGIQHEFIAIVGDTATSVIEGSLHALLREFAD
jgi:hypothetical protein